MHIFFGPQSMDWNDYINFFNQHDIQFQLIYFPKKYFTDLTSYSSLLKSISFYSKFKDYDFILIFQPDCYVFRDEVELWCNKGYDYIGAPWFEGYMPPKSNKIIGIGNGGFSFRKVQSSLRILKRFNCLKVLRNFWFKSRLQSMIRFASIILFFKQSLKIEDVESLQWALVEYTMLEDLFWSRNISSAFSDYKVGSISDAIKFSFEVNPSYLYNLNENKLPFGCHAWNSHEPQFWKQFIFK